jgi:hypothetical protein
MLKLPSKHTDAEDFTQIQAKPKTGSNAPFVHPTETIVDHAPSDMSIDANPTMWKIQLAQR